MNQAQAHSVSASSSSFLSTIPVAPPDSVLGIAAAFRNCRDPNKVNICVGAYRDSDGKPWVLPSVLEAEKKMLEKNLKKEYAPIEGDSEFIEKALKFAYGDDKDTSCIAAVQTLSGTGACRIGGEFYAKFLGKNKRIYIPNPSWGNHFNIFKESGLDVHKYRYYDYSKNELDFAGMIEDIINAPPDSIILLHACAHNPTGCDPSPDQWSKLCNVILDRQLHVFFDCAYQGFASGNAEKDAFALRLFLDNGLPFSLAQSFAKNFGLYGERCGTFSMICNTVEQKEAVMSQLKSIIRPMYSSPPIHGSSIVKTILGDDLLRQQYYLECASMADRIQSMRKLLQNSLVEVGSRHGWSHITNQIGMFAFTGMTKEMCDELTDKYFIFLTKDGRVSLAGLNHHNINYVASAIHNVTHGKPLRSF